MCWLVDIVDHRPFGGTCNHSVLVDTLLETKETAEVINLFGFAMRSGLIADALRYATFTYPLAASDIVLFMLRDYDDELSISRELQRWYSHV